VQNVTFQSMQLLYNESSGTAGVYKGHDSFAVGGQVSARLNVGPWSATPSFLLENWRYQDAILNSSAFAVQATTAGLNGNPTTTPPGGNTGPIQVPGEGPGCANPAVTGAGGSLPTVPINVPGANGCVFSPNGMTNATWVDLSKPNAPVWHFLSNFLYADFILNNQIKTPSAKLPINLILEYEIAKYDGDLGTPGFFVHLDEAFCRRKIDYILQGFESQTSKAWFSEDTFYAMLRLRGLESNAPEKYAEAFYCRKMVY
jgi:hypothetical protein